jgi:hypothetical protein
MKSSAVLAKALALQVHPRSGGVMPLPVAPNWQVEPSSAATRASTL